MSGTVSGMYSPPSLPRMVHRQPFISPRTHMPTLTRAPVLRELKPGVSAGNGLGKGGMVAAARAHITHSGVRENTLNSFLK